MLYAILVNHEPKKSSRSADLQLHVEWLHIPKPVTRGTWRRSCHFDPLKGWRIQAFGVENLPFFQLPLELQYAVSLERCPFPTKFLNKEYQNINHSGMSLPWIRPSQLNFLLWQTPHKAHRSKELHTSFPTRSSTTNLMNSLVTSSLKQGLHQITLISELFINNFINQNFLWKTGGGMWWWNYTNLFLGRASHMLQPVEKKKRVSCPQLAICKASTFMLFLRQTAPHQLPAIWSKMPGQISMARRTSQGFPPNPGAKVVREVVFDTKG